MLQLCEHAPSQHAAAMVEAAVCAVNFSPAGIQWINYDRDQYNQLINAAGQWKRCVHNNTAERTEQNQCEQEDLRVGSGPPESGQLRVGGGVELGQEIMVVWSSDTTEECWTQSGRL